MQPEDIIQQKEWQQLTTAEKELLQPLAATAEEYYLLKNILLNGVEDAEPLPVINSVVHLNLHNALENNVKKKSFARIYYAAASIVLIVIASWALFQFSGNEKSGAKLSDLQLENLNSVFYASKKNNADTLPQKNVVASRKIFPSTKNNTRKNTFKNNIVKEQNFDVAVNTRINDDKNMLALITEVY